MGFRSKISSTSFLLFAVRSRPSSQTGDAFAAVLQVHHMFMRLFIVDFPQSDYYWRLTDGRTDQVPTPRKSPQIGGRGCGC